MRRNGSRFGRRSPVQRAAAVVPPADPIPGLSPFERWRADSGITLATTKVSAWQGSIGSKVISNGTDVWRPVFNAANANINGVATVDFTTNPMFLTSTLGASSWNWLHDGTTGATQYMVYYHAATAAFGFVLSTQAATTGLGASLSPTSTTPNGAMGNGTNTSQAIANGTYVAGKRWHAVRYGQGSPIATSARTDISSSWVTAGTITPSASNATETFRVRSNSGTTLSIAEIIQFQRVVSDPDHATIIAYFASRYGAF